MEPLVAGRRLCGRGRLWIGEKRSTSETDARPDRLRAALATNHGVFSMPGWVVSSDVAYGLRQSTTTEGRDLPW